MKTSLHSVALAAALLAGSAHAAPYVLTNGIGNGTLQVGVDGFGSFGSSIGSNASNALFKPVDATPRAGTTFESGVALRVGNAGTRQFLTSGQIGSSGNLANPTVTGSATSATSSFIAGGLSFDLLQTLALLTTNGSVTGSLLTQTYVITNPGTAPGPTSFELVRYLDGDLLFDGSLTDGGGRLLLGSTEVLFEIDSATGQSTATTFVAISGEGGVVPTTNRFEIDSFSDLRASIIAGNALDDLIARDGPDADQFIDAGNGYDVTLALRNLFSLAPGQTATYVTRTFFGNGAPDTVPVDPPSQVPVPGTLALAALALALACRRRG